MVDGCDLEQSCTAWKVVFDRLPTLTNLRKRSIVHHEVSANCKLCDAGIEETSDHLFFGCTYAKSVWHLLGAWLDTQFDVDNLVLENLSGFLRLVPSKFKKVWQAVWHGAIWLIWKAS